MAQLYDKLDWTSPDLLQVILPGLEPVSLRERLEWYGEQPLQSIKAQKPLDVGFWNPMRDQTELF